MRCAKFRHYADLHLDGALDQKVATLLKAHLDLCPACRAYQIQGQKLKELIQSQPLPTFPKHLHHSIMSQVKAHESQRHIYQKRFRLQLVPAALAIMLSLVFGTLVGTNAFAVQNEAPQETTQSSDLNFGEVGLVDNEMMQEVSQ